MLEEHNKLLGGAKGAEVYPQPPYSPNQYWLLVSEPRLFGVGGNVRDVSIRGGRLGGIGTKYRNFEMKPTSWNDSRWEQGLTHDRKSPYILENRLSVGFFQNMPDF